jgi:hypothetical protein
MPLLHLLLIKHFKDQMLTSRQMLSRNGVSLRQRFPVQELSDGPRRANWRTIRWWVKRISGRRKRQNHRSRFCTWDDAGRWGREAKCAFSKESKRLAHELAPDTWGMTLLKFSCVECSLFSPLKQGCHADENGRTMAVGLFVTWTHCSVRYEVTWGKKARVRAAINASVRTHSYVSRT